MNLGGGRRKFVSVDLNERLFCNTRFETGYLYKRLMPDFDCLDCSLEHEFLFGRTIAGQIDRIGGDIDMAIVDTTHRLPGELLDFLCLLPYMKKGGIVILHDVNLNYFKTFSSDPYEVSIANVRMATKILLSTAKGTKYINLADDMCMNIGAVEIDGETIECADDLFMMLTGTWDYAVSSSDLNDYRRIYEKHYEAPCLKLFDIAVRTNETIKMNTEFTWLKSGLDNISTYLPYRNIPYLSKVAIYGAGEKGWSLQLWALLTKYIVVTSWVDDDWKSFGNEKIQALHTLKNAGFDYLIIAEDNRNTFLEMKQYVVSEDIASEERIIEAISGPSISVNELHRPHFKFPYYKISTGAKICLYGAGRQERIYIVP